MSWLKEINQRNRVLFVTGAINLGLALLMLVGLAVDSRVILGINAWIKPLKFAFSITLFTWTLAWISEYVPARSLSRVSWTIAIAMMVEILLIGGQSLRGTTSHFNEADGIDGIVFSLMGILILISTFAVAKWFQVFLRNELEIPASYSLALRYGLFIFLIGSFEGVVMILNKAHTVGLADGGPGLPLVNWSTAAGDLRVAHFMGLHAIQVIPLFGWAMRKQASGTKLVAAFAILYLVVMLALFSQAMLGRPVF